MVRPTLLSQCMGVDIYQIESGQNASSSTFTHRIESISLSTCAMECGLMDCFRYSYDETQQCLMSVCRPSATNDTELPAVSQMYQKRIYSTSSYRSVASAENHYLAAGKPTNTSGEHVLYAGDKAVDGIYNGDENKVAMPITSDEPNPWLEIDLQGDHCVEAVRIWGRRIFDPTSLNTAAIGVGVAPASDPTVYVRCAFRDGYLDPIERINCAPPLLGRYVRLTRLRKLKASYFTLHEVEVIGH